MLWAVELALEPGLAATHEILVVAPGGREADPHGIVGARDAGA